MGFTLAQKKTLSYIPHFTGPLSLIGSVATFYDIIQEGKYKKQAHRRILMLICIFDAFVSCSHFCSTWPIPEGGAYDARGNKQTCQVQGFFNQLSLMSCLLSVPLALTYVLSIKYGKSDSYIKKVWEPWMYLCSLGFGFVTAFVGLALNLFNNSGIWCWIGPAPPGDPDNNFKIYRWVFFYGPLWMCVFAISVLMFILYRSIKDQKSRVSDYVNEESIKQMDSQEKAVAWQGIFFAGAFYLAWGTATISRILDSFEIKKPFGLVVCFVLFTPAQGFFNALVYFRTKLKKKRQQRKKNAMESSMYTSAETNNNDV